jgi:hypothetical protein
MTPASVACPQLRGLDTSSTQMARTIRRSIEVSIGRAVRAARAPVKRGSLRCKERTLRSSLAKSHLFRRLPDLANAMTAHKAGNGDGGQVSASMLPITAPMRQHNIGISLELRLCFVDLGH